MGVRAATREDLPAVIDALADGFAADPVFQWMFGGDRFDDLLRAWLEMVVGVAFERGPCVIADDAAGASLWTDLGVPLAGPAELGRVSEFLTGALGERGGEVLAALGAVGAHKPDAPPSRHLVYIAVREGERGRGIGRELLAPLLVASDDDRAHAYLHSTNPATQPFYETAGFEPLAAVPTEEGGPVITPMWREPR
jgi:ribosomal protein S18 acetylase RimI-like enzyme